MIIFYTILVLILIRLIFMGAVEMHDRWVYNTRVADVEFEFFEWLQEWDNNPSVDNIFKFCDDHDDIIEDIEYEFDENGVISYKLIFIQNF